MNIQIHPATRRQRKIASIASGVAMLGFAALSCANGLEFREVTVKFGDLDVTRPPGATVLYHRIRAAAREVCSPEFHTLGATIPVDSCVEKSIAEAVAKVNQPALSAILNAKRGKASVERLAASGR
jgi:UrcA family protein